MSYNINKRNAMLKALRMSYYQKSKNGWSNETGAGFIAEDLVEVGCDVDEQGKIIIDLKNNGDDWWTVRIPELNLRETKELIIFLENELLVYNHNKERYIKVR